MKHPPNAIKEPISTTSPSTKANAASNGSERLFKTATLCLSVIKVVWLRSLQKGVFSRGRRLELSLGGRKIPEGRRGRNSGRD